MIRFLIRLALFFAAAAIGLIVAALLLDDVNLEAGGFIIAVLIFGIVQALLSPFLSAHGVPGLAGLFGLLTTFVALLITDVVSDGLDIHGVTTWILATLIVWVAVMLASVILTFLFARKVVKEVRD